jgi:hypothetical protein
MRKPKRDKRAARCSVRRMAPDISGVDADGALESGFHAEAGYNPTASLQEVRLLLLSRVGGKCTAAIRSIAPAMTLKNHARGSVAGIRPGCRLPASTS